MTLDELITALAAEDPAKILPDGFNSPHSYRGYYDELAFEPARNITVGDMLDAARSALDETYQGWKGGDFTMTGDTDCWLSSQGHAWGESIGPTLLRALLAAGTVPAASPARADHTPAETLNAAAFQLRNPFHGPGLKSSIDPELATPLADWLEATADYAALDIGYPTHVVRAFAVARQILGEA